MRFGVALVTVFLSLAATSSLTFGKPRPQSRTEGGGSIAGRVTLVGTPVPGALVLVRSAPPAGRDEVGRCKTDANGRYRVANLQHGRYSVLASALPLTSVEERDRSGREINLDRGETRENVDFSLVRGRTITGRILRVISLRSLGPVLYAYHELEPGPDFVNGANFDID